MGSSYSSVTPKKDDSNKTKLPEQEDKTKPAGGKLVTINWAKDQFERIFRRTKESEGLLTHESKYERIQIRNEEFGRFIDLGPMPMINYVQHHQWREVFLAGPTINSAGNCGNDFPGFYYYDPHGKHEWVIIVEGNPNWQVTRCIRQCNRGRLQIGISSVQPLPKSVFLEVWHQACSETPTQWDALKILLDVSFQLLSLPVPRSDEPDWVNIAYRCLVALRSSRTQKKVGGITGYGAIVEDLSGAGLELLPNSSLAYSLLRASTIPKLKVAEVIGYRLIEEVIPAFFNSELKMFVNDLDKNSAQSGKEVLETWYLLSNLEKVIGLVGLTQDKTLKGYALESLKRIVRLAKDLDYIFPMFINIRTANEYGQLLNPSVLGIYALTCANAINVFPEDRETLLEEVVRSLRVLHRFRIHQIHHEPFQLALAAAAANIAGELTGDSDIRQWRFDFARATLLNMYRSKEYAGLFQACAGLNYPAFKESVETLDALNFLIKDEVLPFQSILSLALRNNLRFFKRNGDIYELPYEGLPTKELPSAKRAGTAIYAAGCAFDLARLQVKTRDSN
ncbi:MAG TPA: hypothetical protein VK249_08410 [Anaerolineales bacterium]|nr:hypothetical protein [Anaerolineales bacterium]